MVRNPVTGGAMRLLLMLRWTVGRVSQDTGSGSVIGVTSLLRWKNQGGLCRAAQTRASPPIKPKARLMGPRRLAYAARY